MSDTSRVHAGQQFHLLCPGDLGNAKYIATTVPDLTLCPKLDRSNKADW